jgi:hypothetical protein
MGTPTALPTVATKVMLLVRHRAKPASTAVTATQPTETPAGTPTAMNLALPVIDATMGNTLEHRQLCCHPKYKTVWDTSFTNELGQLCQGIGTKPDDPTKQRVAGTKIFRPIKFHDIPASQHHDVKYTRVVCEVRPQKEDPNRTCITIGGNRICYPGDCRTKTGSLKLTKTMFNSVLSRRNARFACFDIKNFYLGTPLDRPKFVQIRLANIPQEFIDKYNIHDYAHDGWVYFEISNGVYGLRKAGKLANDLLTTRLATHGYYQCATTPRLWRHTWRPIMFVLIVDNFGLEYCDHRHADHLAAALKE